MHDQMCWRPHRAWRNTFSPEFTGARRVSSATVGFTDTVALFIKRARRISKFSFFQTQGRTSTQLASSLGSKQTYLPVSIRAERGKAGLWRAEINAIDFGFSKEGFALSAHCNLFSTHIVVCDKICKFTWSPAHRDCGLCIWNGIWKV